MRRRGLVALLVVVVLLALGGGAALVATNPFVRARYHLRRITPAEVRIGHERKPIALNGHALAFARSPAARELLPDLIELAHGEAQIESQVCFRPLVYEVLTGGEAKRPDLTPEELDRSTIEGLVLGLKAKEESLRVYALARAPVDARLAEIVIRVYSAAFTDRPARATEVALGYDWFLELRGARADLCGDDPRWQWIQPRGNNHELPQDPVVLLEGWLEEKRDRLPGQVK